MRLAWSRYSLLPVSTIKPQVRAEHEGGVVGEFAALYLAGGDDDAVVKKPVRRLEPGVGPGDGLARRVEPRAGLVVRPEPGEVKKTDGCRPVGARVFGIVLVRLVPPYPAVEFLVIAAEHKAGGLAGAREIRAIARQLEGFEERDDEPGVVIVVLVVPVAARGRRLVSGDGDLRVPENIERSEKLREDRPIGLRLMASGANERGECRRLTPDVIRRAILGALGVNAFGGVPEGFLDVVHHLAGLGAVMIGGLRGRRIGGGGGGQVESEIQDEGERGFHRGDVSQFEKFHSS